VDTAEATQLIKDSQLIGDVRSGVSTSGLPLVQLPATPPVLLDIRNRAGARDRYYHFLLGYLTPLVLFLAKQPDGGSYLVRSCGLMDQHLQSMGFNNVNVLSKPDWDERLKEKELAIERLSGYDTGPFYNAEAFDHLRMAAFSRFGLTQGAASDGVLFINRGQSPEYYQSDKSEGYRSTHNEGKISANLRRSLPNMPEILQAAAACKIPCRLVELETSSLPEQVALFANTTTIVAQHGAALANMIWMPRGSLIVEINPKPAADPFVDCFRDLAAVCGHNYVSIKQETKHAAVDPARVVEALRPYFEGHFSSAVAELLPLAARPASREHQPAWKARFETTLARLAQRPFDLVWIGDSIVHQFERPGPDDWQNYRAIWDKFYKPRNAINLGFAGDDTSNVIWRLLNGQIGFASARLVIIEVGTNNFINGKYNAADTVAGLERIVSLVLDSAPKIRVLLLSIVPSGSGTWSGTPQDEANNRLREAFAGSERVTFVDLTEIFIENDRVDAKQYRDSLENPPRRPVHPHAAAQAQMAALIEPYVVAALSGL
jgi:lysophospholipase L1-like esterase